jgi:hypothetical protein
MAEGVVEAGFARALRYIVKWILEGDPRGWIALAFVVACALGTPLFVRWVCGPVDAFAENVRRVLLAEHQMDVTVYGLTVKLQDGQSFPYRSFLVTLPPPRYSSENAVRCAAWIAEELKKRGADGPTNRST